jgi:predicted metalloprotease with PDZ domain
MQAKPRYLVFAMIVGVAATLSIGSTLGGPRDEDQHRADVYMVQSAHDEGGKAWLGVSVEEETESPDGGARIDWVIDDSPAAQIGLKKGDIIVSLDGRRVYGPGGLTKAIRSREPGARIEIEIVRDGQNQALSAELGERPGSWSVRMHGEGDETFHFQWDQEQFEQQMEETHQTLEELGELEELEHLEHLEHFNVAPRVWTSLRGIGHRPKLGVQLTDVTPELREHLGGHRDAGVLVGKVLKGMPAEMSGVEVGDLIESVDGETIEDAGDLVHALQESAGQTIQLGVVRDGRPLSIDVFIADPQEEDEASGPRA